MPGLWFDRPWFSICRASDDATPPVLPVPVLPVPVLLPPAGSACLPATPSTPVTSIFLATDVDTLRTSDTLRMGDTLRTSDTVPLANPVSGSQRQLVTVSDTAACAASLAEATRLLEQSPGTTHTPTLKQRLWSLLSSLAWVVGFWGTQFVGALGVFCLLILAVLFGHRSHLQLEEVQRYPDVFARFMLQELSSPMYLGSILGAGHLATLCFALIGLTWIAKPRGLHSLNWTLPRPLHVLLVTLLALPLSFLSSQLFHILLAVMPQQSSQWNQMMHGLTQLDFLPLLLVLAVLPAFTEEIIFRGIIGRRIMADWGPAFGIIWTTLLFGLVHLHPAQAIAVLPLGLAMHLVYLGTGSFWLPVWLHFLNNAWAGFAMKYGSEYDMIRTITERHAIPTELLVVSATVVTTVSLLLWSTRTRSTTAHPAAEMPLAPRDQRLACIGSTVCCLGFYAVLWQLSH